MTILIVDGDELGTEIIRVILARSGYEHVQTAASDAEAMRYIAKNGHTLSLIITAWSTNTIEGEKICRAASIYGIPTIALGSYYHHQYKLAALLAGASAYMPTPLNMNRFVDQVDKLLDTDTPSTNSSINHYYRRQFAVSSLN